MNSILIGSSTSNELCAAKDGIPVKETMATDVGTYSLHLRDVHYVEGYALEFRFQANTDGHIVITREATA